MGGDRPWRVLASRIAEVDAPRNRKRVVLVRPGVQALVAPVFERQSHGDLRLGRPLRLGDQVHADPLAEALVVVAARHLEDAPAAHQEAVALHRVSKIRAAFIPLLRGRRPPQFDHVTEAGRLMARLPKEVRRAQAER